MHEGKEKEKAGIPVPRWKENLCDGWGVFNL